MNTDPITTKALITWFSTSYPFDLDEVFETWLDEQFGGIAHPKHPDSQGNLTCSDKACQVTL